MREMVHRDLIGQGGKGGELWSELMTYPTSAALSGMAFFVMGSHYWGRCYAIGALFFILAIVMPYRLEWAPLVFGSVWLVILVAMGRHLGGLARDKGGPAQRVPGPAPLRRNGAS